MRLAPPRTRPDAAACARWQREPPSSPPEGPRRALHDRYSATLGDETAWHNPGDTLGGDKRASRRPHQRPDAPGGPPRPRTDAGDSLAEHAARIRERLLRYDIFPPHLIYATCLPRPPLVPGALIVQRVQFGLFAIEAAVRVLHVWDDPADVGFTYVTLRGHPECGVETFRAYLDPTNQLKLTIEARSQPGHLLSWVGFPVARTLQVSLTRNRPEDPCVIEGFFLCGGARS